MIKAFIRIHALLYVSDPNKQPYVFSDSSHNEIFLLSHQISEFFEVPNKTDAEGHVLSWITEIVMTNGGKYCCSDSINYIKTQLFFYITEVHIVNNKKKEIKND